MLSFRPTAAQALGRGVYLGGLAGLAPFLFALVGWGEWDRPWLLFVPVLMAVAVGAGLVLTFGRRDGADIDDRGIHPTPSLPPGAGPGFTPWGRVQDLHCERRYGRTHIVADLDSGQAVWLRAPYHGRLLAGDPAFERKLFMLRSLWETHRTFARDPRQRAVD